MKHTLFIIFVILTVTSCKQVKKPDFKFQDQPDLFSCSSVDMELTKEAVYVFEDYISEHYAFLSHQPAEGYHNYLKLLLDDRSPAGEFFSDYLIEFKDYLKSQDELWIVSNGQLRLNNDHELVTCIINNIQNEELKNTIDALVRSNTASNELLGPILFRNKESMISDRALATYVVFETFFPKLFYMDSPEFVGNAEKLKMKETIKKDDAKKIKQ
ncbi:MAG: hypothetical protein HKN00_11595 [Flavobacteriaceae bacterium]|nr:hypothetical protein [Bacteroidia bacterium]NNF75823.1 hypothetical protein [Flavobacteriaceae bacterium]NNK74330.1 hypothetical protein [Flavobacteriaceae bacterium]